MLLQYRILANCLAELKKSDLPLIEKLKFEIQLIRIKRILLDQEVEDRVLGAEASEAEFKELYRLFRQACTCGDSHDEIAGVTAYLQKINDSLQACACAAPPATMNKVQRFLVGNIIKSGAF